MKKYYSLYGFIIFESENNLGWIQHVGDLYNTGEMRYLIGRAYIQKEYDVLLLGRWQSIDVEGEMKTFDDVEKYLGSLPKWDKTKYYVKLADLNLFSLIDCQTGEEVYSERNQEILNSLILFEKREKT